METKRVFIHISSGRGPAECERAVALFAERLVASTGGLIASQAAGLRRDGKTHVVIQLPSEYLEDAMDIVSGYLGTVLWVCPSPYRKGCKRKNWFIRVSLGPSCAAPPDPTAISASDLRFETARSSGKGGQNVNKTETAVRVVHLPTGLSVIARDERSQLRNKERALARLKERLARLAESESGLARADERKGHAELERGGAVAVFEGPDFIERRPPAPSQR